MDSKAWLDDKSRTRNFCVLDSRRYKDSIKIQRKS